MFDWLRRRRLAREQHRLERLHLQLLEAARDLQRNGDIQAFAAKTAEAAAVCETRTAVGTAALQWGVRPP